MCVCVCKTDVLGEGKAESEENLPGPQRCAKIVTAVPLRDWFRSGARETGKSSSENAKSNSE